jgi:mRNA degradation ribonuclease J1/J2
VSEIHEESRIAAVEADVARLRRDAAERGLVYIACLKKCEAAVRSMDHGTRGAFYSVTTEARTLDARVASIEGRLDAARGDERDAHIADLERQLAEWAPWTPDYSGT